jgi:hypothetical protein
MFVVFRRCLIVTAVHLAIACNASASITQAKIANLLLFEAGDLVYVYPAGGVVNPPRCHGANGDYYSFSMSRPRAKEYLAALLAAHARGATVTITGTHSCTDQTNSETLYYFSVSQ